MALAAAQLYRAAVGRLLVVVREGDPVTALLEGFELVVAADAALGMGHSLAAGARAAKGFDWLFIALADMPWVRAATLDTLATELAKAGPQAIVQPVHGNVAGHPVGFGHAHFAALGACTGDEGARAVVAANRSHLIALDVDDPGVLRDLDQPAQAASERDTP
jgi:molybdenum cofactor cytidylyltransferase